MIKFEFKFVDKEFEKAKKQLEKEELEILKKETYRMKDAIVFKTPIDTGAAKASWTVIPGSFKYTVSSDSPYMDKLNSGSSKQAPPFFIESTALRFGKPK